MDGKPHFGGRESRFLLFAARIVDCITTTAPQARYLGCLKTKRSGRKEPVMMIIGCDYHPSGQQVFGIDTESGEVVADRWIAHTGDELDQFYSQLPAGTVVGVESSGNMLWFERRLARSGRAARGWECGQNPDERDAQAEARPARRRADRAPAGGRQVSGFAVGAVAGRARPAATAAAPPQTGAHADAGEEPVAAHCPEPGRAEEAAVVEQVGPRTAGETAAGSLDGAAAGRFCCAGWIC